MFESQLKGERYVEWYQVRRNASTMSINQNIWFADYASQLNTLTGNRQNVFFTVLSVGPGEGDNDIQWAKALAQHFSQVNYSAVEQRPEQVTLFQEKVQNCGLANVTFSIHTGRLEEFMSQETFDLIHFVHCINAFEDTVGMVGIIERTRTMLNPGGRILIIQQSEQGVPRFHQRLSAFKEQLAGCLSAELLSSQLTNHSIPHTFNLLDAHLDVTECMQRTAQGQAILGFILGYDISGLDSKELQPVYEELETIAKKSVDGTYQLYEPIGIIEIVT